MKLMTATLLLCLLLLFLPWTQNVRAYGKVTALRPDQRPQAIHASIAGRIEKWYIKEGDFVKQGDTILRISEIKEDYLDPNLLERTNEQVQNKTLAVESYTQKVKSLENQISALQQARELKLSQAKNKLTQAAFKIRTDSMDLEAAKTNFAIAQQQYDRMVTLHQQGLRSLADLETRRLKLQETAAKLESQKNKLLTSRNEAINARLELSSVLADYQDKLAKSESDKASAQSNQYEAEGDVAKLKNQYAGYKVRAGMYYVTAPQDGYVTQAAKTGVGELIKEGTEIISIMPANFDLAIEAYVSPIDMPLLEKNKHTRIQFEGWPAIVFTGWPNASYGTFGGRITAIDNFISKNGKFRVLIVADAQEPAWPKQVKVGSGAYTMVMLKTVPVWYELWRKINGFPPDYINPQTTDTNEKKEK